MWSCIHKGNGMYDRELELLGRSRLPSDVLCVYDCARCDLDPTIDVLGGVAQIGA